MSEHEQIEGLHQRAAENYLQGQFHEALDSWRELLALDPQDERAIEGIRLCELIVQQASDGDFSEPPPPADDPPPVLAPEEGSDVDFDEIARLLEDPEVGEAEAKADDDPGWDFSAFEDTPSATDGLDLADLPALGSEPSAQTDVADFAIPALDLEDSDVSDVQSQIAELLSHASTSYDAGDLEGALTLLDRVFTLDADNVPAAALAKAFRADIETRDEPQAGEGPTPDAVADENLQSLGLAAPQAREETVEEPLVPTPPVLAMADDALSALDEPAAAADPKGSGAAGATGRPARPLVRKPLLIGIAVVAALAAAGFLGFRMTRSDAADHRTGNASQAGILRPLDGTPPAGAGQPDGNQPQTPETPEALPTTQDGALSDPADVPVQATPAEDLATVMARARAAFDAGEFSKAVVAFNEALQISPNNPAARRGLSKAGAAYQEQREFVAKLDSATESFVRGDYRASLRVFYRLPGTEGVPRFDRFKANSWYNLGVAALKTGSCGDAKSHLQEAGALLPGDSGVAAALKFAATCATSQGDARWYDDVQRLAERRLED